MELVVVIALLVLLGLCILPVLAQTQPDTRAFQCLNNQRQLARAWRMYADDNNDRLVGVIFDSSILVNDPRTPWIQGWLDWTTRTDNTNKIFLTDPRYAALANYYGRDSTLFKCPTDRSLSTIQRSIGWKERVRSVSANLYVGGEEVETGPFDPSLTVVDKLTELTNPKPAETWLFMDEHPDSINDGSLFAPQIGRWIDIPSNLHDGSAGVAYADGRAEMHRWQGTALNIPIGFSFFAPSAPPNDPDILWLRSHTPRKPGVN